MTKIHMQVGIFDNLRGATPSLLPQDPSSLIPMPTKEDDIVGVDDGCSQTFQQSRTIS